MDFSFRLKHNPSLQKYLFVLSEKSECKFYYYLSALNSNSNPLKYVLKVQLPKKKRIIIKADIKKAYRSPLIIVHDTGTVIFFLCKDVTRYLLISDMKLHQLTHCNWRKFPVYSQNVDKQVFLALICKSAAFVA